MNIINATPHPINIYSPEAVSPSLEGRRLTPNEGAIPFVVLPPSGVILNATRKEGEIVNVVFDNTSEEIPTRTDTYPSVDTPPDPTSAYIVSLLYATAARAAGRTEIMYTVTGAVYDNDGRPCGCLALQPVA